MLDDTSKLVLRLDATTALLKSQLREAEQAVAGFQADADRRLSRVDRRFDALGKSAGRLKSTLTGFAGGALAGLVASLGVNQLADAAQRALDYAGGLGEAAQAAGVTTKFLQEFRFAAEQNAATIEQADNALSRFSRTLGDARNGQQTSVAAFERLGVSLTDSSGAARTTEDVFLSVADAIAKIPDPAGQASAANAIFGRSFQNILPLLKQGSAGFNQLAADAQSLGIVLSDDLISQADKASDRMAALKRVLEAKIAGAVAENAQSIEYLTEQLIGLAAAAVGAIAAYGRWQAQLGRDDQIRRANRGVENVGGIPGLFEINRRTRRGLPKGGRGGGRFDPTGETNRADNPVAAAAAATEDVSDAIEGATRAGRAARSTGGGSRSLPARIRETQQAAEDAIPSLDNLAATYRDLSDQLNAGPERGSRFYDSLGIDALGEQDSILAEIEARRETVFQERIEQEEQVRRIGEDNIRQLSGIYEDLFNNGVGSVWDNFKRLGIQVISDLLAQLTANAFGGQGGGQGGGLLDGLFGGGGGGGGFDGLLASVLGGTPFGGGRMNGGPVKANTAYLVGERQPEIFVPRVSGTIIPSVAGAGGGVAVTINAPGATAETVMMIRREIEQAAPVIAAAAERRTVRNLNRARLS